MYKDLTEIKLLKKRLKISTILLLALLSTLLLNLGEFSRVDAKEEMGDVNVSIHGYDGKTPIQVSLIDSELEVIENMTVYSPSFSFKDMVMGETYYILVLYKSIPYVVDVRLDLSSTNVSLTVYDTTESDEAIIVDFHHILLRYEEDRLNVVEVLQYRNSGSEVYNGTNIRISMPDGFTDFSSEHECCVNRTSFGLSFAPPQPLKPNETQVFVMSYMLPLEAGEYIFSKTNFYNTSFLLMIVDEDLKVSSFKNLEEAGNVELEGRRYAEFQTSDTPRDSTYQLTITGYSWTSLNILWIGVGALLLASAATVLYSLRGRRDLTEDLNAEREAIESVLQEIEKDFSEGKIKELEYLKAKLKFKEKLEKVERRLKESSRSEVK